MTNNLKKPVTTMISEKEYETIRDRAENNGRSVSGEIRHIIVQALKEAA